jgi:hypothetical protein
VLKFSPEKNDAHALQKFVYVLAAMEDQVREFDRICRNLISLSWCLAISLGLTDESEPATSIILENFVD